MEKQVKVEGVLKDKGAMMGWLRYTTSQKTDYCYDNMQLDGQEASKRCRSKLPIFAGSHRAQDKAVHITIPKALSLKSVQQFSAPMLFEFPQKQAYDIA